MAQIKPFRPLRYTSKAGSIQNNVCPPYDIISPEQREALIGKSEYNLIRLELPVGEDKYNEAGKLLKKWISEGILARDDEDGIFVYEEEFDVSNKHYIFNGIVCLCKTYDFSEKVVLPHAFCTQALSAHGAGLRLLGRKRLARPGQTVGSGMRLCAEYSLLGDETKNEKCRKKR